MIESKYSQTSPLLLSALQDEVIPALEQNQKCKNYLILQIPEFFTQKTQNNQVEKYIHSLDVIFDILLLEEDSISSELFYQVNKETILDTNQKLNDWLIDYRRQQKAPSLIKILLPAIRQCLSNRKSFRQILNHQIFLTFPKSPLYQMQEKTLIIFFLQRLQKFAEEFLENYSKIPGRPLPYLYKSELSKSVWPLKYFRSLSHNNFPYLFSIGKNKIGKSSLLNEIFLTHFEEYNNAYYHEGADIVFSSENFNLGMNVIDFQGNIKNNIENLDIIIKAITPNLFLLYHLNYTDTNDLETLQYILQKTNIRKQKVIILIRQLPKELNEKMAEQYLKLSLSKSSNFQQHILFLFPKYDICDKDDWTKNTLLNVKELQRKIYNYISSSNISHINYFQNYYWRIQEQIGENLSSLQIQLFNQEQRKKFQTLQNKLRQLGSLNNYQEILFPFTNLHRKIAQNQQEMKNISSNARDKVKEQRELLEREFNEIKPHVLIKDYYDIICHGKKALKDEFEDTVTRWQEEKYIKKIQQLEHKKKKLTFQVDKLDEEIQILENQEKKLSDDLENAEQRQKQKKQHLKQIKENKKKNIVQLDKERSYTENLIKNVKEQFEMSKITMFDKEHIIREIIFFIENKEYLLSKISPEKMKKVFGWLKEKQFFKALHEYVGNGRSFQFADGDNNIINSQSIKKILNKIGDDKTRNPFMSVVVLGPSKSGKSTLLNILFNTSFKMNASKHLKGLYASLLSTNYSKAKDCLVLDLQGVFLQGEDFSQDRLMLTLAMSISQTIILNLRIQLTQQTKQIFKIILKAGNELEKSNKKKPALFIVLRNGEYDNGQQIIDQDEVISKFQKQLEKQAKEENIEIENIFHFLAFEIMPPTYNRQQSEYGGNKITGSMVNHNFQESCLKLKENIFKENQIQSYASYNEFIDDSIETLGTILGQQSLNVYQQSKIDLIKLNRWKELQQMFSKQLYDQNKLKNQYSQIIFKDISKFDQKREIQNITNQCREQILADISMRAIDYELGKQETSKLHQEIKVRMSYEENLAFIDLKLIDEKNQIKEAHEQFQKNLQVCMYTKKKEFIKEKLNSKDEFELYHNKYFTKCQENFEIEAEKLLKNSILELNFENLPSILKKIKKNLESEFKLRFKATRKSILSLKAINKSFFTVESWIKQEQDEFFFFEKQQCPFEKDLNPQNEKNEQTLKLVQYEKEYYDNQIVSQHEQFNYCPKSQEELIKEIVFGRDKAKISDNKDKTIQHFLQKRRQYANQMVYCSIKAFLEEISSKLKKINEASIRKYITEIETFVEELQNYQLKQLSLQFNMANLQGCIVSFLYKDLSQKMNAYLIQSKKIIIEDLKRRKNYFLDSFKRSIEGTFGDEEYALSNAKQLGEAIKAKVIKQQIYEYQSQVNKLQLSPTSLCFQIDKSINNISRRSKEEIFSFGPKMNQYAVKTFQQWWSHNTEAIKGKTIDIKVLERMGEQIKQKCLDILKKYAKLFKENMARNKKEQFNTLVINYFHTLLANLPMQQKDILQISQKLKIIIKPNTEGQTDIFSSLIDVESIEKQSWKECVQNHEKYIHELIQQFEKLEVRFSNLETPESPFYESVLNEAVGCHAICPYCGAKCCQSANHSGNHFVLKHHLMGFMRNYQLNKQGKKVLVRDVCDSLTNFKSLWKVQAKQRGNQERIIFSEKHGLVESRVKDNKLVSGKLNISLLWSDENVIDLQVKCPCGIIVNSHKSCYECQSSYNYSISNLNEPIVYLSFNNPRKGKYKINTILVQEKKQERGGSKFTLVIQENCKTIREYSDQCIERYQIKGWTYEHTSKVSFSQHLKDNYQDWTIVRNFKSFIKEDKGYNYQQENALDIIEEDLLKGL